MGPQQLFLCPVCQQGQVVQSEQAKKTLFGTKTVAEIARDRCMTVFSAASQGYALQKKPSDKKAVAVYNDLAKRYSGESLTAQE